MPKKPGTLNLVKSVVKENENWAYLFWAGFNLKFGFKIKKLETFAPEKFINILNLAKKYNKK